MSEDEPRVGPRRRSRERLAGGLVDFLVAPDIKPSKAKGDLARFALRFGYPEELIQSRVEEAAENAAATEARRKARKKALTLTVGTVETIDDEVARLKALGFGVVATRDKVIDAALAALRSPKT